MSDFKNSILVNQQVPEYVREEYPLFVNFLEAYYEFLETKQGTQQNDLVTQAKSLRYVSDVDDSIDTFGESFISNFATLLPQSEQIDKAFLIKNVLPLYLSRGNEKSFSLLFKILYGEEVQFTLPKDNILRASAGDWVVENVLRIDNDVYSSYVGDGETTTFYLAQQALITDIRVYENGILLNSGYTVRKETKKLIFYTAPPVGTIVKVYYPSFDFDLFTSRKVIGTTSGASAIVERAAPRLITQQTAIELYINTKNLDGTFLNAEEITCEIIADDGTTLVTIGSNTISTVNIINVINGGSSYNIGDQVPITGGGFTTRAEAVVDAISTGFVDVMNVKFGGAGFQTGDDFKGFGPGGTVVAGAISTVDTSGTHTANTFSLYSDIISTYASILISNTDYGFPANVIPTGENTSTRIVDALSKTTLTSIGPITGLSILSSNASSNTITYDANSPLAIANTTIRLRDFGSLGRIRINAGGQGYKKGDEVVFGANQCQFNWCNHQD